MEETCRDAASPPPPPHLETMTTFRVDYVKENAADLPAWSVIGRGFYFEATSPMAAAMVAELHCRPGEQVEAVTERRDLDGGYGPSSATC